MKMFSIYTFHILINGVFEFGFTAILVLCFLKLFKLKLGAQQGLIYSLPPLKLALLIFSSLYFFSIGASSENNNTNIVDSLNFNLFLGTK